MAQRMWAVGARFFSPPEQVVYHLWSREGRPVFSDNREAWNDDRRRSLALVRAQLGIGAETASEGASSSSLSSSGTTFGQSVGVDFTTRCVLPRGLRGGLSEEEAARCFCDDGAKSSQGSIMKEAAATALPPNLLAKIMGMTL